jgi:hypothetical protein
MRSGWRSRPAKPRQIGIEEAGLILARGGLLRRQGRTWGVWRSLDARRMRIGIVASEVAEKLLDEGLAKPDRGARHRLVAGQITVPQALAAMRASD